MNRWVTERIEAGLALPRECWTRTVDEVEGYCTHRLEQWGGTSGLFAFQVAREHGHRHIIFCGVPMTESPNAFHEILGIAVYTRHQKVWSKQHLQDIKPFARSMSGWTAELLGKPDEQWLGEVG